MQTTADQLHVYHPFSAETVDAVCEFDQRQSNFDNRQQLFDAVGVKEPEVVNYDGYKPISVLDRVPSDWNTDLPTLVMYLPHANALDPNQQTQVAYIAGTNPNRRIVAVGNPSAPGYNAGRLTLGQCAKVAFGHDLSPTIVPVHRFLADNDIAVTNEYGYSGGATRMGASMEHAQHTVKKGIALEPVVGKRGPIKLAGDSKRTLEVLDDYVQANGSPLFEAARADSPMGWQYQLGLARATILAESVELMRGDFESHMDKGLKNQTGAEVLVTWGIESELATHGLTSALVVRLAGNHAPRVTGMPIPGRHMLGNFLPLQAAIVLEGQR